MQEFLDQVKEYWKQKSVVESVKEALEGENAKLTALKMSVLKMMEAAELEKQHLPGFGTVYRQPKFSVKVPKTLEDKFKLFSWIEEKKGKEVLDALITINSQTLNSFYKTELELAVEERNPNFKIPGIAEPETYFDLASRKGK